MARLTTLLFAMWLGVTVSTEVDLEKRVYGGEECGPKDRQYHVQVITTDINGDQYLCGGSLISDQWILTAAHCFKPRGTYTAHVGVHAGPLHEVDITKKPKIFKDPFKFFFFKRKKHDLMLLKLPEAVEDIDPVQGPDCTDRPNIGAVVQVAGHGPTTAFPNKTRIDDSPDTLQCADMNITDCQEFKDNFNVEDSKHEHWICASSPRADACPGDSGGGVVYKDRIYGVIEMGHATEVCAAPVAFMDLCHPPYLKWIKDTIKEPKITCCFG